MGEYLAASGQEQEGFSKNQKHLARRLSHLSHHDQTLNQFSTLNLLSFYRKF